jgi:ribosomal-protein-alanine N-acetyltransferase
MAISLKTDRLLLCPLGAEHAETVQDYLLRNKAFFKPWSPIPAPDFFELESIEKRMHQEKWNASQKKQLRFYIFSVTDKAKQYILGDIHYSNLIFGAFQSCFLGYKTDQRACGKGIMTEALQATNAYLFEHWGLHRIEANIMPSNKASLRVVEKLNFDKEGLARNYLNINGQWEDHLRFALRKD